METKESKGNLTLPVDKDRPPVRMEYNFVEHNFVEYTYRCKDVENYIKGNSAVRNVEVMQRDYEGRN